MYTTTYFGRLSHNHRCVMVSGSTRSRQIQRWRRHAQDYERRHGLGASDSTSRWNVYVSES